jgi:hypothetical protein
LVRTWVYERNLLRVLGRVARLVGHALTDDEWAEIRAGVGETDAAAGEWFEVEWPARRPARLALARNPAAGTVQLRVEADEQTLPQVERWLVQDGQYRAEGES